jgi:hypothetical protein
MHSLCAAVVLVQAPLVLRIRRARMIVRRPLLPIAHDLRAVDRVVMSSAVRYTGRRRTAYPVWLAEAHFSDGRRPQSLVVIEGSVASGEQFAAALRHDPRCKDFNPHLRQLLHVGYKVAAEMGGGYLSALEQFRETIARNVTENILERHLKPVFIGR